MADIVIREVAKDVWIFSKPFTRSGLMPIGGRSTAIKLQSGDVWVLASTPLSEETKARLDEMGPVKYIIGADMVHHLYLRDFKKAFPEAKLIAPVSVLERPGNTDLKLDGAWGKDPEGTKYGFEDDIQHCYFSGFKNKDVAFFHSASKSLIQADLLFNLPGKEQFSKSSSSASSFLTNSLHPGTWLHSKLIGSLVADKEAMKRDVKTVLGWGFERIIPCHGDVIEKDAEKAWRDSYKAFMDD
jgi:hypothetical protein